MNLHEYYRDAVPAEPVDEGVVDNVLNKVQAVGSAAVQGAKAVGSAAVQGTKLAGQDLKKSYQQSKQRIKDPEYWSSVGTDVAKSGTDIAKDAVGTMAGFLTSAVGFGGVGKTVFDSAAKNLPPKGMSGKLVDPLFAAFDKVALNSTIPAHADDRAKLAQTMADQLDKLPAASRQFAQNNFDKFVVLIQTVAGIQALRIDRTSFAQSMQLDPMGGIFVLTEIAPFLTQNILNYVDPTAAGYPAFSPKDRSKPTVDECVKFLQPVLDDARTVAFVYLGKRTIPDPVDPKNKVKNLDTVRVNGAVRPFVQFVHESGLV